LGYGRIINELCIGKDEEGNSRCLIVELTERIDGGTEENN
jgi:hypothetical protein